MTTQTLDRDGTASPPAGAGVGAQAWLTLLAVTFGIMIVQIDGTVVAIANPAIAGDLKAGLEQLQWVTNGYLLALAGLMIPAGNLADRLGRRTVFLAGVIIFAGASLLAGLSGSIELLIAARVVQGVGGALLLPSALGLIRSAFPPEKLSMAIGIWGGASALGLAGGPIIGGLLVENASWNWVFYINVPVAVVAVAITLIVVRETREGGASGLDLPGALVLTGAMTSLVWAITRAQKVGWGSVETLGFIGLALVLLVAFIAIEKRVKFPTVPLELFRNRSLSIGTVLMVVVMFAMFGVLFFVTFYLQGVQGKGAVAAGVALLPLTLVFTVASPVAGFVTQKLGARSGLIMGSVLLLIAFALFLRIEVDSGFNTLWPPFVLLGFGMGFLFISSTETIVGNAPPEKAGTAGGLQQSAAQLGGVLGTAVLGTVMASQVSGNFGGQLDKSLTALTQPGAEQLVGIAKAASSKPELLQGVELGFPPSVQEAVLAQLTAPVPAGAPGAGLPPMPAEAAKSIVDALATAAHHTFVGGMHTVFLVAGAVAVLGGVLSLFVRNQPKDPNAVKAPVVHV